MQLIQTVAPTSEPLTLEDAKEFIRVLDDNDDLQIASMISTTREHIENTTNRQLMSATFELYADKIVFTLPKNPIQSISKIEYMDESGDYVELDNTTYYLFEDNGVGHIHYDVFPSLAIHKKAFKVTFISGYLEVPESIKHYMKVKLSTLYENREQYTVGVSISEFGNSFIENLLSSYKIRSF